VVGDDDLIAIKGGVMVGILGFVPGRFEVNVAMIRVSGWFVSPEAAFKGEGAFVHYRHRRTGPSYFWAMNGDGQPVSHKFLTYSQEPRLLEALSANGWPLFERRQ